MTFIDPVCISGILCNYEALRERADLSSPASDIWCLMEDFDKLLDRALKEHDIYKTIVWGKTHNL